MSDSPASHNRCDGFTKSRSRCGWTPFDSAAIVGTADRGASRAVNRAAYRVITDIDGTARRPTHQSHPTLTARPTPSAGPLAAGTDRRNGPRCSNHSTPSTQPRLARVAGSGREPVFACLVNGRALISLKMEGGGLSVGAFRGLARPTRTQIKISDFTRNWRIQ
jgi:hypothetical protein